MEYPINKIERAMYWAVKCEELNYALENFTEVAHTQEEVIHIKTKLRILKSALYHAEREYDRYINLSNDAFGVEWINRDHDFETQGNA